MYFYLSTYNDIFYLHGWDHSVLEVSGPIFHLINNSTKNIFVHMSLSALLVICSELIPRNEIMRSKGLNEFVALETWCEISLLRARTYHKPLGISRDAFHVNRIYPLSIRDNRMKYTINQGKEAISNFFFLLEYIEIKCINYPGRILSSLSLQPLIYWTVLFRDQNQHFPNELSPFHFFIIQPNIPFKRAIFSWTRAWEVNVLKI